MVKYRGHAARGHGHRHFPGNGKKKENCRQMNRKQFFLLLVALVVIGAIGLVVLNRKEEGWQSGDKTAGQKILPEFPLNDIAQVSIQQHTNQLNLVKQDDLWRVQQRHNYPASFSEIGEFLRKVWELKPVQEIEVGPSQFGRLELVMPDKGGTNSATVVNFKDKTGKTVTSLLLGKKHMKESQGGGPFGGGGGSWPDGRYVMVNQAQPKVWLVSETFSSIEPKADHWLNKDFFKVEKVKSIAVVSTNATNSWKLTRETETGDWSLADKKEGEELDKNKTYVMNNALSSPSFNDVLPPDAKPEETGMDHPLTATIETFDQFTYTVKLGKTNDENYNISFNVAANIASERTPGKDEKPEDKEKLDKEFKEKNDKLKEKLNKEKAFEKWTYVVSKWTIDPLLKQRHELLAEKKAEEKKDDANSKADAEDKDPTDLDVKPPEDSGAKKEEAK
jgi:hypothetical protein